MVHSFLFLQKDVENQIQKNSNKKGNSGATMVQVSVQTCRLLDTAVCMHLS